MQKNLKNYYSTKLTRLMLLYSSFFEQIILINVLKIIIAIFIDPISSLTSGLVKFTRKKMRVKERIEITYEY